jgi:pyruvate/2-oxoglutarate dehydrogenase complex dihydrolipoamide acyltransferase (E2) component
MAKLDVRMPQFGESAAEATVVAWLVKPGEAVAAEQELVEVQTEKSLLTVAAPAAGVLAEQMVAPGAAVAVGEVLAFLTVAAEAMPTAPTALVPAPAGAPAPPTRPRRDTALRATHGEAAFISPAVRERLVASGLKVTDLSVIPGSGAGGRVTVEDIDRYLATGEPMSAVRQAVAKAMERSWARPLATVAMEAGMDALLEHRRSIAGRPSATIYGLRALALGLAGGNALACRIHGYRLIKPASIDLAVAVEVDDGVVTPVIRGVEKILLPELTAVVEEVIAKARSGRVGDIGEAVGSVSNYGTFGITWATPIPLPGQGLILGIGAVENKPEWEPALKSWGRRRAAEVTLTFDHRIADGGAAGRLLKHIVDLLEHPEKM